eukprot:767133-Hanusia_phi.AAC.1
MASTTSNMDSWRQISRNTNKVTAGCVAYTCLCELRLTEQVAALLVGQPLGNLHHLHLPLCLSTLNAITTPSHGSRRGPSRR